jgi:hypothetical protein
MIKLFFLYKIQRKFDFSLKQKQSVSSEPNTKSKMDKIILFAALLSCFVFTVSAQAGDIPDDYCEGIELGILPFPIDIRCDLYVLCVYERPFLQACGPDEIFVPQEGADPPFGQCKPGTVEYFYCD